MRNCLDGARALAESERMNQAAKPLAWDDFRLIKTEMASFDRR